MMTAQTLLFKTQQRSSISKKSVLLRKCHTRDTFILKKLENRRNCNRKRVLFMTKTQFVKNQKERTEYQREFRQIYPQDWQRRMMTVIIPIHKETDKTTHANIIITLILNREFLFKSPNRLYTLKRIK